MSRQFSRSTVLFLLVLLLLSACSRVSSVSPEALVISKLVNTQSKVNPFTIQVLQKVTFKEHVFILAAYQANRKDGGTADCERLFDIFQDQDNNWTTLGGHLSCSPTNPHGLKLSGTGMGLATLAGNGAEYSYIYGRLSNDDITTFTVTWGDGVQQSVSVNKNAYLTIRDGKGGSIQVEGTDKTGSVVYHESFSP